MTNDDAERWDRKWAAFEEAQLPSRLLHMHRNLLSSGLAADVACGLGQNTRWLAAAGYQALGLDISEVALDKAWRMARRESMASRTLFLRCDLAIWPLAANSLDLICVFRFLKRDLFASLQRSLRPGGLLFYETRHRGVLRRQSDSNPAYLLQEGELAAAFPGMEQVYYEEDPENARLVARRPRP